MKTQSRYSLGRAALSYALILLSADVVAKTSKSTGRCTPQQIGNGHCDKSQNNEACGYDGGDCCECTCNSGPTFSCRSSDFVCIDPAAECVENVDGANAIIANCTTAYVSDGDCDPSNNNEECGYDGGDCCQCTCVSTTSFTCGDEFHGGFECLDPSAPCVADDDDTTSLESDGTSYTGETTSSSCIVGLFSDGDCDVFNNNEECGYDGGDCCECTCVSEAFTCGDGSHGGFSCLDPGAPCVDDDDVTTLPYTETLTFTGSSTTLGCVPDYFSDGLCDLTNNNEDCGYDGGDCCECTCVSTPSFTCGDEQFGGFACLDPSAPCVDDDDFTALPEDETFTYTEYGSSTLGCVTSFLSDAYCDQVNNNEICGYDGGDCCQCTCVSNRDILCGEAFGFACIDPLAPCVDDDDVTALPEDDFTYTGSSTTLGCVPDYFSDGLCDMPNNNEDCGYDGGDCCECTCVSTSSFTCGDEQFGGFACLDPSAPCVDDDDFTALPDDETFTYTEYGSNTLGCVTSFLSDAYCDQVNNNEICGYDGGDCCQCTCVSNRVILCGEAFGFACLDPSAPCVDDDDVTALPEDDFTYTGSSTTLGCVPDYFSDGLCDMPNNNEDCGYDGGDCCECTCVSTSSFTCGDEQFGGFACLDPSAPCVDDDDFTALPDDETFTYTEYGSSTLGCVTSFLSDAYCDQVNNNEICGYDGGDCCQCTCVSNRDILCGEAFGFACLDPSAPCVDDDDVTALPEDDTPSTYTYSYTTSGFTSTFSCATSFLSDGDCDSINNKKDCGFDGGDCCECTCVDTESFTCGDASSGGFDCIDPSAPCVDDDDDIIILESTTSESCVPSSMSDGLCDPVNNNEECDFDGGDCCECTCVGTVDFTCGDNGGFDCIDPGAPCQGNLVEAGTKTTIGASTNTYDTRAGEALGGVGCGEDGCEAQLTRDESVAVESRWACAQKLDPDGGPCEIVFAFEEPQDILEVQVAFFKGDERSRTLQARINGGVVGDFDSNPLTPFTSLNIQGTGVESITLTTVGLAENDWIALLEVRFMVEP